jgi:cytochrome c biogenesis protein CcmG, thiol:disulfide interchange protein DsbE
MKAVKTATPIRRMWALPLLTVLCLLGLGISSYLTWHHEVQVYGDKSATLANCQASETINCDLVNTSAYSEILGIPLATLAIPVYLLFLVMIRAARKRPGLMPSLFAGAFLTVLFSAYLFYISKVKIGYLCVWCLAVYAVNLSLLAVSWLALGSSPWALLKAAYKDLRRFSPDARFVTTVFASVLVATLLAQRVIRTAVAASAVSAPKVSSPQKMPVKQAVTPVLKQLEARARNVVEKPFDLSSRLGKGVPVALIQWSIDYLPSGSELVKFARFFEKEAKTIEVYAVAEKRAEQSLEMVWERFRQLPVPTGLPLLIDEEYGYFKSLDGDSVPNVVLFDGKGKLITPKIKSLSQLVSYSPKETKGYELIQQVARGEAVEPLTRELPYYPATELLNYCAPKFTATDFSTGSSFTFAGKSSNGKPTLLVFWSATCSHCQKEIPKLVAHYKAHPGQYNVVSVTHIKKDSPDGKSHRKITEAYSKAVGIPWPILEDPARNIQELYKVVSNPTTILIDAKGNVQDAWFFVHEDMEGAMTKALAKLNSPSKNCRPLEPDAFPSLAFSMTGPKNETTTLSKVVDRPSLVHFWATWCVNCQTEMSSLLRYAEQLEKLGGRLVLISVEDKDSGGKIQEYAKQMKEKFSSYRAPAGGLASEINLGYSVPRTFLVLPGGRVVQTYYGTKEWDNLQFQNKVRALLQLGATRVQTASR